MGGAQPLAATMAGGHFIGVDVDAKLKARTGAPTRGRIWMTATPINEPGSAEVSFTGLVINGDTDGVGGDLLILLGRSPEFAPLIAAALTQNFTHDLEELQGKIKRAVDQRREGAFLIRTRVDRFETGVIKAYGNGLYLPVRMVGGASVDYRPAK